MSDTKVKFCGHVLKNPVIPASGTFGFGYEFAEYYDINILGSIALKGTTLEERYGNPLPRIAECPAGLINAIGLQNPGADAVIKKEIKKLNTVYSSKVIANVGGHSVKEYVETAEKFNACGKVWAVELNISCPNVKGGGMAFGTDAKTAEKLVYQVKKSISKPLIVKLSPNVTDITEIARAAAAGGADGLSLINTLVGMRIDLKTRKPVISVGTGGYSGSGIFPVAVRMVSEVYRAVNLPLMGMGGVSSARDVIEMMMAGATAVQIGAANLVDPFACKEIIEQIPSVMAELNIEKLSDIVGVANEGFKTFKTENKTNGILASGILESGVSKIESGVKKITSVIKNVVKPADKGVADLKPAEPKAEESENKTEASEKITQNEKPNK